MLLDSLLRKARIGSVVGGAIVAVASLAHYVRNAGHPGAADLLQLGVIVAFEVPVVVMGLTLVVQCIAERSVARDDLQTHATWK